MPGIRLAAQDLDDDFLAGHVQGVVRFHREAGQAHLPVLAARRHVVPLKGLLGGIPEVNPPVLLEIRMENHAHQTVVVLGTRLRMHGKRAHQAHLLRDPVVPFHRARAFGEDDVGMVVAAVGLVHDADIRTGRFGEAGIGYGAVGPFPVEQLFGLEVRGGKRGASLIGQLGP